LVLVVWLEPWALNVTCAPTIAAPVASCTTPLTMVCCDQAKDTTRENKKRWNRKLIALEIACCKACPRRHFGCRFSINVKYDESIRFSRPRQISATGYFERSKRYRPPWVAATDSAIFKNARPACDSAADFR